jgi:hypothetical protein
MMEFDDPSICLEGLKKTMSWEEPPVSTGQEAGKALKPIWTWRVTEKSLPLPEIEPQLYSP